jgi:hypothetical protein
VFTAKESQTNVLLAQAGNVHYVHRRIQRINR